MNLLLGCSAVGKVQERFPKNETIYLTDINEIRENLNGYWVSKNQLENPEILWLNFNSETNASWFLIFSKNEKYENIDDVPQEKLNTIVKLIKEKDLLYFEMYIIGIENIERAIVEYIKPTEFKISEMTFIKVKR